MLKADKADKLIGMKQTLPRAGYTGRKAVLVDLDGTIADCSHRRQHVESKPKNWKAFNALMHLDAPINPIRSLVSMLHQAHNIVIICTGRESVYRQETVQWLIQHKVAWHFMLMRHEKDYREDPIVKSEMLDSILEAGYDPWLVLDDRQRVVDMWRARGLTCLQVAPGDF